MIARGALQLWANYLVDDLDELQESATRAPAGPALNRVKQLSAFAQAVQRGANPRERADPAVGPPQGLAPTSQDQPDVDEDHEYYALAVLFGDNPDARAVSTWANSVRTVADAVLDGGWESIPPELHGFPERSLMPFLARVERIDEAPKGDFVSLALQRTTPQPEAR